MQVSALAPALALALTIVPAGSLHVPARTVRAGRVVCDHPEPYVYCAVQGDGLFELWVDADRLGGMCPVAPQSHTPTRSYLMRPMIQWVPVSIGRQVCWSAGFFRAASPTALTWNTPLTAASIETGRCTRSRTDHVEITPLEEVTIDGDGPLVLRVKQQPAGDPVEVLGVYIDVDTVYP